MRKREGDFGEKGAIRKRDIDARFGYVRNHQWKMIEGLEKYGPDFFSENLVRSMP